jgi:predicted metalloprotease
MTERKAMAAAAVILVTADSKAGIHLSETTGKRVLAVAAAMIPVIVALVTGIKEKEISGVLAPARKNSDQKAQVTKNLKATQKVKLSGREATNPRVQRIKIVERNTEKISYRIGEDLPLHNLTLPVNPVCIQ